MKKKAQGISMNVIVIAAIALLVLIVLIAVFSGRMGIFNKNLDEQTKNTCKARTGNDCQAAACGPTQIQIFGTDCKGSTPFCCALAPS
jgi:hypothetical protein